VGLGLLAGCLLEAHTLGDPRGLVVLLPLGSLEDRPRGPWGLDTLLATAASCLAARGHEGLTVAPPLGYGFSPCHRRWTGPGEPRLLERLVRDTVAGLGRAGARGVVVVNGHYGQEGLAEAAARATGAGYVGLWRVIAEEAGIGLWDWERLAGLEEALTGALLGDSSGEAMGLLRRAAERVRGEAMRLLDGRGPR
jgi:creatinine amidohydrolase/Fe(II)-dependent formamide hydrolase-like protein